MKCGMHHLDIFVVPQCFGKEQNYILDLALHKAFTKRYEIFWNTLASERCIPLLGQSDFQHIKVGPLTHKF